MAADALILKECAMLSLRSLKSFFMLIYACVMVLVLPFRGKRKVSTAEKDEKLLDSHRKGAVVRVPVKMVPWKNGISISTTSNGGGGGAAMKAVDQVVVAAMARRELAIRGVVENDIDKNCVREYLLWGTKRGDTIFTQSWTPVSVKIRGLVLIMHGLNEHSGRYSDFAKQLNANGYKVYAMDWVGHGGSDGLHGYVHCLDDAVSDMKEFLEKTLAENPGLPCFCLAHSTGGAITLKALLDPKIEAYLAGVAFTSPAVGVERPNPIILVLAPIVSYLLPRYPCDSAYKKGLPVCRDPQALIDKYSDPLVYTGPLRVRTGYEILQSASYLQQNLRKMRVPFLVMHGTADSVTEPEASKKLYAEASSSDKTLKLYEGFSHDLLFEPERDAISQDIIEWLNSRI